MKRKQEQNDRSSSLAITLCGLAVCLAAPLAQAQDDALEEIIVKGKRGSLLQSLDQKRNATSIVDSFASEELGRSLIQTSLIPYHMSLA